MSAIGLEKNFVDTQGISLTNVTDTKTYTQLTDVIFTEDSNVTRHQRTDDVVENVFSLFMDYIEANITLTTPELTDLKSLTLETNGVRAIKEWKLEMNDSNNNTVNSTMVGQVKTLRIIDPGISVTKLFIRIEGAEGQTPT